VGKYVSPKGNAIHGKGLEPSVTVEPAAEDETTEGAAPRDLILEKGLEVLKAEGEKKKAA
jgi:C-terminal processing protease CtpA/Prc